MLLAFAFEVFVSNYSQQLDRRVDGFWLQVRWQFPLFPPNPFGCIRCLHQMLYDPPKFRIIELFSSSLGRLHQGVTSEAPGSDRSRTWGRPAAVAGVSFWAPFFLPAPLQPDKQRGNKVSAGMPGSRSGCRAQSSAVPDGRSPVIPGSLSISHQLPPRAEVRMLINTRMKGSCWVVINICH